MSTDPSSPSVLVVDDDEDICRNLADILGDLGYRVDTASNGIAALELVRRTPYDVALLDFRMPGMDGLELYRQIKKERAGTVAIIVSAYTNTATREAALTEGAWQVLAKPVDLPRLLRLVDEALGQPLVMIVDDDPDLRATLWDLLRERGFRVSLANDACTAAAQVRELAYKLFLIDMRLPDGDGSEVFHAVRKANPNAHTVIITGHPRELGGRVEQVLLEGADAVCYKPFDVPALLATLDRLTKPGRED
jgi:CheY-like chemotaxis protein